MQRFNLNEGNKILTDKFMSRRCVSVWVWMCVGVCVVVGGFGCVCFGHSHVSESVRSTDLIPADEAHIFCQI